MDLFSYACSVEQPSICSDLAQVELFTRTLTPLLQTGLRAKYDKHMLRYKRLDVDEVNSNLENMQLNINFATGVGVL